MLTTSKQRRSWKGPAAAAGLLLAISGCMPPGPKALLDGERLLGAGRAEEAIRRLRTAVEILPSNAQAWNHLGLAYHEAGRPAEAMQAYDRALQIDRNLTVAYFNSGCLHLEQGQPALAVDSLWAYVGLQPRVVEGWVKLGQAQLRSKKWEQAERSFLEALRLHPARVEALNGLGVAYHQRRKVREAWQSFTNAVSRDPSFAPAWLNLGVIAHQNGAKLPAIEAYRQYAKLRPDRAQRMELLEVIRQLQGPPASTIQLPPAPLGNGPASSNPPAASPAFPAQPRASIPKPLLDPAPNSISTEPAPELTTTHTPALARPPPDPVEKVESVVKATEEPETRPATTSAPTSAPAPAPVVQSSAAVPSDASTPGVLPSEAALTQTSSNAPDSFVLPPTTTVPSTAASIEDAVRGLTNVPAPPVERVELAPSEPILAAVRDENTPPPAEPETAPQSAASSTEPPPLVRPIPAQRPASSSERSEKRGFWSRANPVNWFDSDSTGASSNAEKGTSSTAEESGGSSWKWANPVSWFKGSGDPGSDGERGSKPGTGAVDGISPTPDPMTVTSNPITNTQTTLVPVKPASDVGRETRVASIDRSGVIRPKAVSPKPAVDPVSEMRRYAYLKPALPDPGDRVAARVRLSVALQEHRRERFAVAIQSYEEAVKLDPSFTEAFQNLAVAALQAGDVKRALSAGETALVLQPQSAGARVNFALALDQAGFPVDAAEEAERVVASKPDDVAAHLLLGNLNAQKLGRAEQARIHYMRVIELEPDHPQSIAIRRWLAGRP